MSFFRAARAAQEAAAAAVLVELDEEVLAELDPLSLPAFAAAAAAPEPLVSPPPSLFVAPSLAGVSPPVTVLPEPDRLSVR
jgi:hypothetical protein